MSCGQSESEAKDAVQLKETANCCAAFPKSRFIKWAIILVILEVAK